MSLCRVSSCLFLISPSDLSEAGTYEQLLERIIILETEIVQAEDRLESAREAARHFRFKLAMRLQELAVSCGPPPPLNE